MKRTPEEIKEWYKKMGDMAAILDAAAAIVVAHNHPSGNLEPSVDDLLATRRLADAGWIIGIPLIDHLIVTPMGFVSLRERFPDYLEASRK